MIAARVASGTMEVWLRPNPQAATLAEVRRMAGKPLREVLLTAEEFKVAERYFGITEEGNFEDHSHPQPLKQLNVLSIVDPKLTDAEAKLLAAAKQKLFAVQVKRIRPHLDDRLVGFDRNERLIGHHGIACAHMPIDDLDFVRRSILPDEAKPPLIVDPDAVLSGSVAFQGLQAIA